MSNVQEINQTKVSEKTVEIKSSKKKESKKSIVVVQDDNIEIKSDIVEIKPRKSRAGCKNKEKNCDDEIVQLYKNSQETHNSKTKYSTKITKFKQSKISDKIDEVDEENNVVDNIVDETNLQKCNYCDTKKELCMFRHNRRKCKDCEKADGRAYRQSDIGKTKAQTWSNEHKEYHHELQSNWAKDNREHLNDKYNNRMKMDKEFNKSRSNQQKVRLFFKGKGSRKDLVGCTIDEFTDWLEFCLPKGLEIDDHGEKWHMDHVIPVNEFNLLDEKQEIICYNYLNYMPVVSNYNLTKNNRIDKKQLETHKKNIEQFHAQKKLEINKEYMDLLARHLK